MKKQFQKLVSFAAMLAVAVLPLTSCSDDSDNGVSHSFVESEIGNYIEINGNITESVVLKTAAEMAADGKTYLITDPIVIHKGGSLTVPAGLTIKAEAQFASYILVAQGGKMYVNGTSTAPVIFTTKVDDGNPLVSRNTNRWGGLIVNGYAPISGASTTKSSNIGSTEIATAYKYGGNDEADNSGSFTYMVLDRTGAKSNANVEHNGLTLNGVGNGTVIENIYISNANDDAVEFFGGSVNVTNLLAIDSDDDMFDFTQGYSGKLKNCYGIWTSTFYSDETDPSGVEADGNLDGGGSNHYYQSVFSIENMTIDNKSTVDAMDAAIVVRRGATATITNALVKNTSSNMNYIVYLSNSKGNAETETEINVCYQSSAVTATSDPADLSAAGYDDVTISQGSSNAGYSSASTDFAWVSTYFDATVATLF